MSRVIRIGTRKSALALAQTRSVVERCRAVSGEADIRYEIIEMSTAGDRIPDRPLYLFDGKGMFTSVFEEALAAGEIDAAVHSGKDMPGALPDGLIVSAALPRANPRDVLVTLPGRALQESSVIGTGSLRRQEQVTFYLGYAVKGIRGNVNTRLQKLRDGEVDGLILAAAGLERLCVMPESAAAWRQTLRSGLCGDGAFFFRELHEADFVPAPAQGIIAVESRRDSPFAELFAGINDKESMCSFLTERAFLSGVGAGCQQPVAAYSWCQNGTIRMRVQYWREGRLCTAFGAERMRDGERMAAGMAEKILAAAGQKDRTEGDGQ